tara:strand:- start:770 stop:994 length:225 start_codon:yes stop_codon:yes gene_type:complete
MASDPLQVGGVKWPNMMQKPTGIVAGAANPAMDPTALSNAQMPAESAKVKFQPTSVDTSPSTDATKGRVINTYV